MNRQASRFALLPVLLALACGGGVKDSTPRMDAGSEGDGDQGGDGDGSSGDGDSKGDGDHTGDGDGPVSGDGDGKADGGTSGDGDSSADGGNPPVGSLQLPPVNGSLDYQLGGAYDPPSGVNVVSRDRNDAIASGIYNVCYVNGYQVQRGEENLWGDLILKDKDGNEVIDPDWQEKLVDISTADKRAAAAELVGSWIDKCKKDGFAAVEIDNLDSYSRAPAGLLTQDDAVDFMKLLSARAHKNGLAIAQKNSSELLPRHTEMGTDFSVAEECSRYDECQDYIDVYGKAVLMIEYRQADFDKGCAAFGSTHAIVLRDLDLVPKGQGAYVFDDC
jgi:hypothetical protein